MAIRALLIEDSPIIIMHLRQILEQSGIDCIADFPDGEQAIEYLKEHSVDIIFIDISLEGSYDGIETSEIIVKLSEAPFIFLTASNDPAIFDRAKLTSAYTYIHKPFTDSEILTNIELALVKKQQEKANEKQRQLLAEILDSIHSYVLIIREDLSIEYVNDSLSKIIKRSSENSELKYGDDIQLYDKNDYAIGISYFEESLTGDSVNSSDHFRVKTYLYSFEVNDLKIQKLQDAADFSSRFLIIFNDAELFSNLVEKTKVISKNRIHAQILGEELEKERLSKDLHDGLGQTLNAIKMNINTIDINPEARNKLKTLIDAAIQESHEISENLTPLKLQHFRLDESINDLCKHNKYEKLSIDFTHNSIDEGLLTNEIKLNLYRITQEALSNIIKHSEANFVSIQLYQNSNRLTFTIEDDGKGFDFQKTVESTKPGKNLGLINMTNRIKAIDGCIEFDSSERYGTCINVELNLSQHV